MEEEVKEAYEIIKNIDILDVSLGMAVPIRYPKKNSTNHQVVLMGFVL